MALLLIVLALFGFVAAGVGSGSSGSGHVRSSTTVHFAPTAPKKARHHHLGCSARMKARLSADENQRCGGPPANP